MKNLIDQINKLTEDKVVNYDFNCDCIIFILNDHTKIWVEEDLSESEIIESAVEQINEIF